DAGALAGWQALDVGSGAEAWRHYETAKAAAREAQSDALLAHAMGEQSFALLDIGEQELAVGLFRQARTLTARNGPPLLKAWLHAAEAEAHATAGITRAAAGRSTQPMRPFRPTPPTRRSRSSSSVRPTWHAGAATAWPASATAPPSRTRSPPSQRW